MSFNAQRREREGNAPVDARPDDLLKGRWGESVDVRVPNEGESLEAVDEAFVGSVRRGRGRVGGGEREGGGVLDRDEVELFAVDPDL